MSSSKYKQITNDELELPPLVESSEKLKRRICRCPTIIEQKESAEPPGETSAQQEISDTTSQQRSKKPGNDSHVREASSDNNKVRKLEDSLVRFGPLYSSVDQPSVEATKHKAWDHVLKKSTEESVTKERKVEQEAVAKEKYLSALRKVEQEAKEAYSDKITGIGSKFRWTMIKDGCFFLQLALSILGSSPEHLGYQSNDPVFGRKQNKKDVKKWIEAMFFPGNQIPLVVLHELMNQQYFQGVLAKRKWDPSQSDLCKKVFYEFLVLPAAARKMSNHGLCIRKEINGDHQHQPSDLLHGLQKLVLGPVPHGHLSNEYDVDGDGVDLEANEEETGRIFPTTIDVDDDQGGASPGEIRLRIIDNSISISNSTIDDRKRIFPCATELKRAGIRIKKLKNGGGVRSINFTSWYFWAYLYLPSFPVDDNTEILFRNLKTYEISQQFGKHRREVSSYLRVMSDIVQTQRDVKLLKEKYIIVGKSDDAEKLPGILNRLSSSEEIRLTHEFRLLRSQIRDYSSPLIHYKSILNIVVFLTVVQAFFAILAYVRPPPN
ncbi:hypothetical protein BUALT_BualtUnG0033200 [Buddleja alternifolia]|uniref:Uncharacterized protein n=1 Tax=Buddleja alternifolia TaxID=168488 RepID=A0AAV6W157_9LAMI|nr:hypothetical protein BUALT_BualtUnG0033200 [Buddleja alternifolia]